MEEEWREGQIKLNFFLNKKYRNQLGTDIWRERREKQHMIILISLANQCNMGPPKHEIIYS